MGQIFHKEIWGLKEIKLKCIYIWKKNAKDILLIVVIKLYYMNQLFQTV